MMVPAPGTMPDRLDYESLSAERRADANDAFAERVLLACAAIAFASAIGCHPMMPWFDASRESAIAPVFGVAFFAGQPLALITVIIAPARLYTAGDAVPGLARRLVSTTLALAACGLWLHFWYLLVTD